MLAEPGDPDLDVLRDRLAAKTYTSLLLAEAERRATFTSSGEEDPAVGTAGRDERRQLEREIAAEHLATHFSELPRLPSNMPWGDPASWPSVRRLHRRARAAFLDGYVLPRMPGASFEYSNYAVRLG